MTDQVEVMVEVIEEGEKAGGILACLATKYGDSLNHRYGNEHEVTFERAELTHAQAVEEVKQALSHCDQDWPDHIFVHPAK